MFPNQRRSRAEVGRDERGVGMAELDYILICFFIPIVYVVTYIAGKYNLLFMVCKMLEETLQKYTDEGNNGWIPCSERLPEEDGFYNVTVKFWHMNNPTVISSHFENGEWTCVALDAEDVVIAWQPLPDSYKGV